MGFFVTLTFGQPKFYDIEPYKAQFCATFHQNILKITTRIDRKPKGYKHTHIHIHTDREVGVKWNEIKTDRFYGWSGFGDGRKDMHSCFHFIHHFLTHISPSERVVIIFRERASESERKRKREKSRKIFRKEFFSN